MPVTLYKDLLAAGEFRLGELNGEGGTDLTPGYFADFQHMQEFMDGVISTIPVSSILSTTSPRTLEEMVAGITPENRHPE